MNTRYLLFKVDLLCYMNRSALLPSSISQEAPLCTISKIVEAYLQNIHQGAFLFRLRIWDIYQKRVALAARQKLLQFNWDVHPLYSPDLDPSDYYLFLSLKSSLQSKCPKSISEIKITLMNILQVSLSNFWNRA